MIDSQARQSLRTGREKAAAREPRSAFANQSEGGSRGRGVAEPARRTGGRSGSSAPCRRARALRGRSWTGPSAVPAPPQAGSERGHPGEAAGGRGRWPPAGRGCPGPGERRGAGAALLRGPRGPGLETTPSDGRQRSPTGIGADGVCRSAGVAAPNVRRPRGIAQTAARTRRSPGSVSGGWGNAIRPTN